MLVNSVRNEMFHASNSPGTPSAGTFLSPTSDNDYRSGYDSDDFEDDVAQTTMSNILSHLPSPEQVSLLRSDLDINEACFLREFAQLEQAFNEIIN